MGDQVAIKPWEVRGEGREFEAISAEFTGAARTLESQLATIGTPWGTDEPGSGFGTEYAEARERVLTGLHGLADRIGGVGAGLNKMADNAEQNEDQVRSDMSGVYGTGGGSASI